jgi:hypothetical protein
MITANSVMESFDWSVLTTRYSSGSVSFTLPVTGSLMSGLAWTSKIGNAWNNVMAGLAMWMLDRWGVDSTTFERYIRGDDSTIFCAT